MRVGIVVIFVMGLMGCATPSQYFKETALKLSLYSQKVSSDQFQHQIYLTKNISNNEILHVYIDGDGTPWERNRWIADDPTARNPLILRLMIQDNTPAILLGRPCYYGLNVSPNCHYKYWTSHRYSKEVVDSMTIALNAWLDKHKFKEVVLIGYSGGGSIAVLMANNIQKIKKVVTLAANLDLESWSEYHGYPTLKNSLNPADEVEVNTAIRQIHFAGEDDEIVPAFIVREYANSQKNAKYYEYADKDHACCWEEEWLNMLDIIE